MRTQPFPWLAAVLLSGGLTACAGTPTAPTDSPHNASALTLRPVPPAPGVERDLTNLLRRADALHLSTEPEDDGFLLTVRVRNPLDRPLEALKIIIIDNPRTRGPRRLVLEIGTLESGDEAIVTAQVASSNPPVRVTGR